MDRIAIIPAGGRGTRIRNIYGGQKACIRFADKSLIEYAISSVESICDIAVVVGGYGYEELKTTVRSFESKYNLEALLLDENTTPMRVRSDGPSRAFFTCKRFLDQMKLEAERLYVVLPDTLFINRERKENPGRTLNGILRDADKCLSTLQPFQTSVCKQFPISRRLSKYGVFYQLHPQQLFTSDENGFLQNIHEFGIFEKIVEKPSETEIDGFREEFDRKIAIYTGTNIIYEPGSFLSYFAECEQHGLSDRDHIEVLNVHAKSLPWTEVDVSGKQMQVQAINVVSPGMSYVWMTPPEVEVVDVGTPEDLMYAKSLLEK